MDIGPIVSYIFNGSYSSSSANGVAGGAKNDGSDKKTNGLTPDQQREVEKLKATDQKVKAHEAAHLAAAGGYAKGGAHFDYERGPDGNNYAVGGEVDIDTSPVKGDPRATIRKMETVQSAALAPADPSPQDRRVAAEAAQEELQAQQQLAQQQSQNAKGGDSTGSGTGTKAQSPKTFLYKSNGTTANQPGDVSAQILDLIV